MRRALALATLALASSGCSLLWMAAAGEADHVGPCVESCATALRQGGSACSGARGAGWYEQLYACACSDEGAPCAETCGALFCAGEATDQNDEGAGAACNLCLGNCINLYLACANNNADP